MRFKASSNHLCCLSLLWSILHLAIRVGRVPLWEWTKNPPFQRLGSSSQVSKAEDGLTYFSAFLCKLHSKGKGSNRPVSPWWRDQNSIMAEIKQTWVLLNKKLRGAGRRVVKRKRRSPNGQRRREKALGRGMLWAAKVSTLQTVCATQWWHWFGDYFGVCKPQVKAFRHFSFKPLGRMPRINFDSQLFTYTLCWAWGFGLCKFK